MAGRRMRGRVGNRWKNAKSAELFASWQGYATRAGDKPGSQKSFADALQKRGIERHKGTGGARMFRGVRLITLEDIKMQRKTVQ